MGEQDGGGASMADEEWVERACRAMCRMKGLDPKNWLMMKPRIEEAVSALREAGVAVVAITGEVE